MLFVETIDCFEKHSLVAGLTVADVWRLRMTMPTWRTSMPFVTRDEHWQPVEGQVGTVETDQGLRVAVHDGEHFRIYAPGADEAFSARFAEAVAERQAATETQS